MSSIIKIIVGQIINRLPIMFCILCHVIVNGFIFWKNGPWFRNMCVSVIDLWTVSSQEGMVSN
jgi:hypothetical protein